MGTVQWVFVFGLLQGVILRISQIHGDPGCRGGGVLSPSVLFSGAWNRGRHTPVISDTLWNAPNRVQGQP